MSYFLYAASSKYIGNSMTLQVTAHLFQQSQIARPYPPGVVEPPQQIVGTSFFPGGHGVWESETALAQFPLGGVMVLGHDFHNEAGYLAAMAKWQENLNGSTWRPLISFLAETGVSLSKCFLPTSTWDCASVAPLLVRSQDQTTLISLAVASYSCFTNWLCKSPD